MEERRIENITYFNIGAVLNSVGLILFVLPQKFENELIAFGSRWGGWWYSLIDSAPIIFVLLGSAAMAKAFNYKHMIWPNSKNQD